MWVENEGDWTANVVRMLNGSESDSLRKIFYCKVLKERERLEWLFE